MYSSGNGCGCDAGARYVRAERSSVVRGLLRGDVGHIGAVSASASAGAQLSPAYLQSLAHYAAEGGQAPQDLIDQVQGAYDDAKAAYDKAASTYEDVKSGLSKAEDVYKDAQIGAAIGIVLGPYGAAAGAVIGAIYGVFDNFGGDIMAVLNPPDFSEDDYTRMKQKAIASGGIPNWGVPPDQYGGAIYPDGSLSGGDWPYPGTWNGEIRDQAAFDRHRAIDAKLSWQVGFCIGPTGAPEPCPPKPTLKSLVRGKAVALILKKQPQLLSKSVLKVFSDPKFAAAVAKKTTPAVSLSTLQKVLTLTPQTLTKTASVPAPVKATAVSDRASLDIHDELVDGLKSKAPLIVGGVAAVGAAAAGVVWLLRRRR